LGVSPPLFDFDGYRAAETVMLDLTVQAEELLRMNERIKGERTVSELQDRVTELIEWQRAIVAKRTSTKMENGRAAFTSSPQR
jgi:hypothetical protein